VSAGVQQNARSAFDAAVRVAVGWQRSQPWDYAKVLTFTTEALGSRMSVVVMIAAAARVPFE